ncbi:MAG: transglycosylase, partial [Tardiphaga sp.]|nr:transglycosylase [Tardiphaga sp.]
SIFYDRSGSARSVSDVYSVLTSRYASAANSSTTRTAMASAGVMPSMPASAVPVALASAAPATAAAAPIDNAAYLSSFPDVRSVTPVTATSTSATASPTPAAPIFRSLFQGGDRSVPVSPAVQELWGNRSSLTSASLSRTPDVRAPQPLDLFSDRAGTFSS